MPDEEKERTRVDRLLTEAGNELESIKTFIGDLPSHPSREQIERLVAGFEGVLEKIQQAGTDHKAYYQTAQNMKGQNNELVRKIEALKTELEGFKPAVGQNEELLQALHQAKEQIQALKEEIDKLSAPPNPAGTVHKVRSDGKIWIFTGGKKVLVNASPEIDAQSLKPGQEVILNDALNIVEVGGVETQGEVVTLKELMEDGKRARVNTRMDQDRIVELAEPLRALPLKVGDPLLIDIRSGYGVERLPKNEAQDLLLFEVPNTTYKDIGGLGTQIEKIRDAIELPFLHAEKFKQHKLDAPKGILIYGPPGCGKTLIAKAVANSLAKEVEKRTGTPTQGYFINIKGPELLNKYVGETERKIREIFQRAREKANEGMPVIIFFDELDSLLRTRGSGISSDVESTIVPQFLAEIDGVEGLKNVIVLGASNRQDLIDPAVLRPGRFDVKIEIGRPDQQGIKEILGIYLTPDLPLHSKYTNPEHKEFKEAYKAFQGNPAKIVEYIIERSTERICATDAKPFIYTLNGQEVSANNRVLKLTERSGEIIYLYVKDFASGAMIKNIVTRAKKIAVKRAIGGGEIGLKTRDLGRATEEEIKENQDLPNTSAGAEDWLRLQGHKGDIVHSERVALKTEKDRPVQKVTTGQYL